MSAIERPQFATNHLLADFHRHERFHAMIHHAKEGYSGPPVEITLGTLSGKIFEEVGFLSIYRTMPTSNILLSPEQTIAYFAELYPSYIREIPRPLQPSLNAYVPDGVVGQWNEDGSSSVVELVEFTASKGDRLVNTLYHKALSFQKLRARYPDFFGKAKVHFVLPENTALDTGLIESLIPFFRFSTIPVSSFELGRYTSWVGESYFGLSSEEERALAK